jgi:hypothetical protein
MQGWLGSKETVLFTGRGPIRCARMSGTLLAWATDSGLRWGAAVPSLPALPSACLLSCLLSPRCHTVQCMAPPPATTR